MIKVEKIFIQSQERVLVDIAFDIYKKTALVGQSGSGKSLTLKAILNLLPSSLKSEVKIDAPFNLERGKSVAFIPQNPFTALSPLTKISKQFFASKEDVFKLFDILELPKRLFWEYPPNLSGGQLQRVIFAMALIHKPKLLLLDEPTTALDASLRDEIVALLKQLQKEFDFYMLFVTHDINLALNLCEDMVVLNMGKVVESGKSMKIAKAPKSSYTKILFESSFENREFRQ